VCKNWKVGREAVLVSREMLAKGIDPSDRQKYRDGEMDNEDEDSDDDM